MFLYLLFAFAGDEVPGIILPKDQVDVPILQVKIADARKYATYLECTQQADTKRDMLVYIGPKGPSCDSWAAFAKRSNWQFCHETSFAGFNYGPNRLTWDGKQWCFNPNQPTGDAKYAPSEAEKKSLPELDEPFPITQDTTVQDADETNTESQDISETEATSTSVPDADKTGVTSVEVVSEAGRQGCGVNGCSLQYSGFGVRRSYSEEETIIDGGGGGGGEVAFSSRKSMKKAKKSAKKAVKHEFKSMKHARKSGRHRARFAAFSGGGC